MNVLLFSIIALLFGGFGTAAAVVAYHLRRYAVPSDHTHLLLSIFLIGTVVFAVLTVFAFLNIPWDSFSVEIPYRI